MEDYQEFKENVYKESSKKLQQFFETEKGKEELNSLYYYHNISFPWSYIKKKLKKLQSKLVNLKS